MAARCGSLSRPGFVPPAAVALTSHRRQTFSMASHMPQAAAASVGAATAAARPLHVAYVYCGPGAGARSVLSTMHSLREALLPTIKVASLDTTELLEGGWQEGCLLLVMPGGADLPYCKHLNGRGNTLIREYVEGGGAYLGLCAGAYYACSRVEFEPGTRLEVVGDRELAFFPGKAVGSIYPGFCYESEAGAVAARLRFRPAGACCSRSGSNEGQQPQPLQPAAAAAPAAVQGLAPGGAGNQQGWSSALPVGSSSSSGSSGQRSSQGQGGSMEWAECRDYVNGGPGFVLLDGSPLPPLLDARAQLQQSQACQQQQWRRQQRGHGVEVVDQGQAQQQGLERIELLATFPERSDAAAALLCHVGSQGGRAVLCGSHPELHPEWLVGRVPRACGDRNNADHGSNGTALNRQNGVCSSPNQEQQQQKPVASSGDQMLLATAGASVATAAAAPVVDTLTSRAAPADVMARAAQLGTDRHVQQLQAALDSRQEQRWHFWCSLLAAAGLQAWLRPRQLAVRDLGGRHPSG